MMELFSNVKRIVLGVFCIVLFYSSVLWLSLLLYGLLYYWFIPAAAHIKPIYLQFPPSECATERLEQSMCSFPFGNVTLINEGDYQLLGRGHIYAVELALDMPESVANREIGMFMVQLEMLSKSSSIIQYSSRPAILSYKSYLFQMIYTLFYTPYLLAGSFEEKQVVVVPLFEEYLEDSYQPTHFAYVRVLSKSIQIYSCYLRIHAQFRGFRYYMYYWPVLSMLIGVATFFFFICISVLVVLFHWMKTSELMNLPAQINARLQRQRQRRLKREERKRRKVLLRSGEISSSMDVKDSSDEPTENEGSASFNEDLAGEAEKLQASDDEPPDFKKLGMSKSDAPKMKTSEEEVRLEEAGPSSGADASSEEMLVTFEQCEPEEEESELLASLRKRRV